MWDNECEAKVRGLLYGRVDDTDKPPLDEQRQVADRLNLRLPYPGWMLRVDGGERWWECAKVADDRVRVIELANRYEAQAPDRETTKHSTLMEALTALELGL